MERLTSIQGLRGFAVGGVLACHAGIWAGITGRGGQLLSLGASGVDLFFVISGFCLAWAVMRDGRLESLRVGPYLRRRAWRILPPYYAALAASVVTAYLGYRYAPDAVFPLSGASVHGFFPTTLPAAAADFAAHATMTHGFFPPFNHSIDGAFWSLSTEWQFYLVLPVVLLLARRLGVAPALVAAAIASVAFSFLVRSDGALAAERWVATENIAARLVEFAAGMLAAAVASDVIHTPRLARSPLLLPLSALSLAATAVAVIERPSLFLAPLGWAVGYGLLVLALVSRSRGLCHRAATSAPAVSLGAISYSVYLIHGTVFLALDSAFAADAVPRPLANLLLCLGAPLASVAAGHAFHMRFERPAIARAHRRRDPAPAAAPALGV